MVRFSFMRDCGSIPHEIPLLVRLNSSKKVPKFNISNYFRLSQFLLKTPPQIYSIIRHKLKLETAAVGVQIPHGDSTVSTFKFFKKSTKFKYPTIFV